MNEDQRMGKAMADGAEFMVRQLEHCQRVVSTAIERAHKEGEDADRERSLRMEEAQQFIRLAGEIGTALAKMKNENRQRITVERIGAASPPHEPRPQKARRDAAHDAGYSSEHGAYAYERRILGKDWTPEKQQREGAEKKAAWDAWQELIATRGASATADTPAADLVALPFVLAAKDRAAERRRKAGASEEEIAAKADDWDWGDDEDEETTEGEGEGYDKQLDVVDGDLEPAS